MEIFILKTFPTLEHTEEFKKFRELTRTIGTVLWDILQQQQSWKTFLTV